MTYLDQTSISDDSRLVRLDYMISLALTVEYLSMGIYTGHPLVRLDLETELKYRFLTKKVHFLLGNSGVLNKCSGSLLSYLFFAVFPESFSI